MPMIPNAERPRLTLDDILSGPDEFGHLDVKAIVVPAQFSADIAKFNEICDFIKTHERSPEPTGDLYEKSLHRRLRAYQLNTALHEVLQPFDLNNLLSSANESAIPVLTHFVNEPVFVMPSHTIEVPQYENVTSLDDIFNSDCFAQMDSTDNSLFDIQHIPTNSAGGIAKPDEVAQFRACQNFYIFEPVFADIHAKIASGEMTTAPFQFTSRLEEGDSFILDGVVFIVDQVGEYRHDNAGRYDPRLRLVFENGTESNHYMQSMQKRLSGAEQGVRLVRPADSVLDSFNNVSHRDKLAGQIYFVTTTSTNPVLAAIPDLVKIGYTSQTVEERTKNAANEPAFLEAPIRVIGVMDCYNLNPNKFETLIHGFLHAQRLNVTLTSKNGSTYKPNEWFSVPIETVREVVKRIIDGSIVHYRMDNTTGRLLEKSQ